ncbi:hypothetical protein Tco_0228063 [Tanacetum coccineum]
MWPSYDPDKKMCDGRVEICGVSKTGNLRFWYYNYDDERRNIKGKRLSFLDFILAKYRKSQTNALVWDNRYVEWCDISPSSKVSSQESNKPRPRDYTFREWTLVKVGHTDISEPVKKALLELWLIDCFQDDSAIVNNLIHRSFVDYNQVHNSNYGWHNHGFKEEERDEIGGQSFVCVSKDLDDVLPLGRKNGSKFKEMI